MMNEPSEPASIVSSTTGAASWLLAAYLLRHLPRGYALSEEHPMDGHYDLLVLRGAPNDPSVLINRAGSIHVRQPDRTRVVVADESVWHRLTIGSVTVSSIGSTAIELMSAPAEVGSVLRASAFDVIAATLRTSALFGLGWHCLWGYRDSSGYDGSGVRHHLFKPYEDQLKVMADNSHDLDLAARGYWFLVDGAGAPVASFNVDGHVYRSGSAPVELATAFPDVSPFVVASDLLGNQLVTATKQVAPASPGWGIAAVLEVFNRKERYFLLGSATTGMSSSETHGPSMTVNGNFMARVSQTTGWKSPSAPWLAMDYHLSWLHAALQWRSGKAAPHQSAPLPLGTAGDGSTLVSGNQEDADLVLAWADDDVDKIVLIEAKAYGRWTRTQLDSKIRRLTAIIAAVGGRPLEVKLVLVSPEKARWDGSDIPDFLRGEDGAPAWFSLEVPGERLRTTRTDDAGIPSDSGMYWRIAGPNRGK